MRLFVSLIVLGLLCGSLATALLPDADINSLLDSPKTQSALIEHIQEDTVEPIEVIAQFTSPLSNLQETQLRNLGADFKYVYEIIPAAAFTIDSSALVELEALTFVKRIELDAVTHLVVAQSAVQIEANRVWLEHDSQGQGIIVAILDTGIDNEHADLKNVIAEQDFTGQGTDDDHGHGTHVASTVAGSGELSGGVNKGIAPEAQLMDIKVLGRAGTGKLSDTIAGIEYGVLHNADILSLSLGAQIPCNGLDATSLAADTAVKRGVHVIVAAGNTGPLPGTIGSPGCARDVVTVGAVDRLDNIAAFSSRGPTLDGRTKPDIVAPGVLILAAQAGGTYTPKSGTSMATPIVSGVVALILSDNSALSPAQVKDLLQSTAKDLGESVNAQGAGRVDAYSAFIEATGREPAPQPEDTNNEDDKDDFDEDKKKAAARKTKEDGHVDRVDNVKEKRESGNTYYVVRGSKDNNSSVLYVYVDAQTGEVDKIVQRNKLVAWLYDFVEYLKSIFS